MLRRAIAVVFILLILSAAFLLPASAESSDPFSDVSFSFPDGYQKLTRDNLSRNNELVKRLGHTPSTLKDYMKKENIYFIGAGEEAEGEFHIKSWENEFSKKADSFIGFTTESLAELNQSLFGGNAEVCTVENTDTVYFRTKSKVTEADFYTYQYTTIESGRFYSFIYYGSSSQEIDSLMKTVKFSGGGAGLTTSEIIVYVVTGICIVLGIAVMGIIGIGIFRDVKNKSAERQTEETQSIKIKRRKM